MLIVGHMHSQRHGQLDVLTTSFLLAGLLLRRART